MATLAVYPGEQSVDVALRDGSTVHVRPVRPGDRDAIHAFLSGMSDESLYYRCFGTPNIQWLTDWSVDVDYSGRYGVIVTTGADVRVVAHAAYVRIDDDRAEVAFEVAESMHGHGIATLLLAHLAGVAARNGISRFTAKVLMSNRKMIDVFRDSGFPVAHRILDGVTEIELPTTLTDATLRAFERREQVAAVGAVQHLLAPESVAVIGASRRAGAIGSVLLANLVDAGFTGNVYPINRKAGALQGLRCYPSVLELPESPELAVVAVPAAHVCAVARDCAAAGVRGIVVISAGFAETGEEGGARQRELVQICRESGMRLIGPNSLGVLNTDPAVKLDATLAGHQRARRQRRLSVAERRARDRPDRGGRPARPRPIVVRLGR